RIDRNAGSAVSRKAIDAGRDGGKGNRGEIMVAAKPDRGGIAGGKQRVLAMSAAIPHRPDSMDHIFGRQAISTRDLGVTGLAAAQRTAFGKQLRPGRAMDGAIDATAA